MFPLPAAVATVPTILRFTICKHPFTRITVSHLPRRSSILFAGLGRTSLNASTTRTLFICTPKLPQNGLLLSRYNFKYQNHQQTRQNRFAGAADDDDEGFFHNFDITLAIISGLAGIYFAVRVIWMEKFVNWSYSFKDKDGKLVPMRKPLIEEIFTIQEEANYSPNYKTMDLAMYEFSRGLQPFQVGGFLSRCGVYNGLPIYLNYNPADPVTYQADIDQFCEHFGLRKEVLEVTVNADGINVLEQLKNAFTLSPEARRYLLLSMLHTATTPVDPFFHCVLLLAGPLCGYKLARRFIPGRPILQQLCIFNGYLVAFAIQYVSQYISQRYGSWAAFNLEPAEENKPEENNDDSSPPPPPPATTTTPEDLLKGAQEFLTKLATIESIVAMYSTDKKKAWKSWSRLDGYRVYTTKARLADLEKLSKGSFF